MGGGRPQQRSRPPGRGGRRPTTRGTNFNVQNRPQNQSQQQQSESQQQRSESQQQRSESQQQRSESQQQRSESQQQTQITLTQQQLSQANEQQHRNQTQPQVCQEDTEPQGAANNQQEPPLECIDRLSEPNHNVGTQPEQRDINTSQAGDSNSLEHPPTSNDSLDTRPTLERYIDGAEDPIPDAMAGEDHSFTDHPLFEDTAVADAEDEDPEAAEWSRLRCSSVQTEVITERSRRNGQPSAGYPGLAFGSSVFGSNTMMKLRIISNELHNIMNVYLKRAEGEMVALNNRIQVLENDLGKSEQGLKVASSSLEEAMQAVNENESIGEEIETRTSIEDGRIALLDYQLNKARLLAEETDKNYKDMAKQISLQGSDISFVCRPRSMPLMPLPLDLTNDSDDNEKTQT